MTKIGWIHSTKMESFVYVGSSGNLWSQSAKSLVTVIQSGLFSAINSDYAVDPEKAKGFPTIPHEMHPRLFAVDATSGIHCLGQLS